MNIRVLAASAALLLTTATALEAAVTNELYVAQGQTKTLTELLSGITVNSGDCIRKTGTGTLTDDTSIADVPIDIIVEEGVWSTPTSMSHTASPTVGYNHLVVKRNASLWLGNKNCFLGKWILEFEGEGTGSGGFDGAIVVGTAVQDSIIGSSDSSVKRQTGDATIYCASTSDNSLFCSDVLDCQGYTLTLKGKSTSSRFRPRWSWTVTNATTIIVDKCIFDRHYNPSGAPTVIRPRISLVKFINNGSMASQPNDSLWKDVETFEFDAGCGTVKASNSRSTVDELTMSRLVGPMGITALMQVTVTNELVSRASDFAAGNKLSSVNTFTIGSACRFAVRGWGATALTLGQTYDIATVTGASAELVGTPAPAGASARLFTVAKSGKTLQATLKSNVIYAGFAAGIENAAANTARVAALVSSLNDGDILIVEDGEYAFTDGVADFSALTKRNIVILGENGGAKLKATLKLGAAENLTVEGIGFLGTTGPALEANGTDGLSLVDCTLDTVVGTCTEGHYAFLVKNVTDFSLQGVTYANCSGYDGEAYFDGGTQLASSEIVSGALTVRVLPGENIDWATAKARLPLAVSAYNGKCLRLVGGGRFTPAESLVGDGVTGVEIVAGRYVCSVDNQLGKSGKSVTVRTGATLELKCNSNGDITINSRTVHVSGTGVDSTHGAVHISGNSSWKCTNKVTWELDADAKFTSEQGNRGNGTFLESKIKANGHVLTLLGGAWRFGWDCSWQGGGELIVDNAAITASSGNSTVWPKWNTFVNDPVNPGRFVFRNKAELAPDSPELLSMFNDVTFETTNCVLGYSLGSHVATTNMPKNYVFRRFAGAPQINDPSAAHAAKMCEGARQISVTVTNEFVALAANVFAVAPAVFTIPKGDLTFAPGCTFTLDEPTGHTHGTYELCRVLGDGKVVTGHPKSVGATREANWATRVSDGGRALYLCERPGLVVIVR